MIRGGRKHLSQFLFSLFNSEQKRKGRKGCPNFPMSKHLNTF